MKQSRYKIYGIIVCTFLFMLSLELQAPTNIAGQVETNREENGNGSSSCCDATLICLQQIKECVTGIKNCLSCTGPPIINDPEELCLSEPIIITDSNPDYANVNLVRLAENITFKPIDDPNCGTSTAIEQAAIIIEKDNVTLDLAGFTLEMSNANFPTNTNPDPCSGTCPSPPQCIPTVHGILVKEGVKNTKIVSSVNPQQTKGAIRKFSGYGIYVGSTTGTTEQVQEITINNISIQQCFSGIHIRYGNSITVKETNASNNCNFTNTYGMEFILCQEVSVVNSITSFNHSCQNVYGIYFEDCEKGTVSQSQIDFNRSSEGNAYGIHVTATSDCSSSFHKITLCSITENQCSSNDGTECVGIYLGSKDPGQNAPQYQGTFNNFIESCEILSNKVGSKNISGTPQVANAKIQTGYSPGPIAIGIKLDYSNFNEIKSNRVGNNATQGIIDTKRTGTNGSTSLFTNNFSFFNGKGNGISELFHENYSIVTKSGQNPLIPFPVVVLNPADINATSTSSEFQNFEVVKEKII